jgi:hypothetical protein
MLRSSSHRLGVVAAHFAALSLISVATHCVIALEISVARPSLPTLCLPLSSGRTFPGLFVLDHMPDPGFHAKKVEPSARLPIVIVLRSLPFLEQIPGGN